MANRFPIVFSQLSLDLHSYEIFFGQSVFVLRVEELCKVIVYDISEDGEEHLEGNFASFDYFMHLPGVTDEYSLDLKNMRSLMNTSKQLWSRLTSVIPMNEASSLKVGSLR
jgi:hypothetical protein